jgi:hypothetical protein
VREEANPKTVPEGVPVVPVPAPVRREGGGGDSGAEAGAEAGERSLWKARRKRTTERKERKERSK